MHSWGDFTAKNRKHTQTGKWEQAPLPPDCMLYGVT